MAPVNAYPALWKLFVTSRLPDFRKFVKRVLDAGKGNPSSLDQEVYAFANSLSPKLYPKTDAKGWRDRAWELYADAIIAQGEWSKCH